MASTQPPEKESKASANVLLDRALPDGYLEEWTEVLSRQKEQVQSGEHLSLVIFRLRTEWFALPTQLFKQIQQIKPIHSLPLHLGGAVKGLVNVRGRLEVCADLYTLLDLAPKQAADKENLVTVYARMAVLEIDQRIWVITADEIYGIHHLLAAQAQNAPVTVSKSGSNYLSGMFPWRKDRVGIIDEELMVAAFRRSIS